METVRYNPPTKFDCEDYGTLYRVINEDESSTLWIQIGPENEQPKWIKIGDILEKIFYKKVLENSKIIPLLLELYAND